MRVSFLSCLVLLAVFINQNLFSQKSSSQELELLVSVNKTRITIGDILLLNVTLKQPKESNLQLSLLSDQVGSFEIIDYSLMQPKFDTSNEIEYSFKTIQYKITSYLPGEQAIPALSYRINNSIIGSSPILIKVESVLNADDKTLSTLKSNLIPNENIAWWVYLIVSLSVLLLITLVYFIFRWVLRIKEKPYYDLAEYEINRLLDEGVDTILAKRFYFKLDKIVKHFFAYKENQYGILAMTSRELKQYYSEQNSKAESSFIDAYADYTDRIKFSHREPDPLNTRELINDFKVIISNTRDKELKEKGKFKT